MKGMNRIPQWAFARTLIVISPSLFARSDKRLCLPAGQSIYKPRCCRSVCSMLIAMLLIIGGVEVNPGPNFNSKFINFGLLLYDLLYVAHLVTRKAV